MTLPELHFVLSWLEVHGALTHFPIAMWITAALFEIGAVVFRRPAWRTVSFWTLLVGVVVAIPALIAGWMAGSEMFGGLPQPPAIFLWHRALAFTAAGVALILLIWRVAARDQLAGRARAGAVVLVSLAAAIVGFAGFLGGQMVLGGAARAQHGDAAPGAPAKGGSAMPQNLAAGRQLYQQNCAGCHGANGEGKIGPALAGSGLAEASIKKTVIHGKPPRMPALGPQLSPAQIDSVADYVHWLSSR